MQIPNPEDESLPVGNGDDRTGIHPHRLRGRLGDNLSHLCLGELFRAALRVELPGGQCTRNGGQNHG